MCIYIYIILFLAIYFNKIALCPLNNIFIIFKSKKKILAQAQITPPKQTHAKHTKK